MNWIWGPGGLILDPFRTLFWFLFTSAIVCVGARLFVPASLHAGSAGAERLRFPHGPTFQSALCIVAYGLSPAIFAAVPYFGTLASWIYAPIVTVIGAREIYRVSNTRATVVGLFPSILLLGIMGLGAFMMLAFFLKLASSMLF
jgi:hypothetical protein